MIAQIDGADLHSAGRIGSIANRLHVRNECGAFALFLLAQAHEVVETIDLELLLNDPLTLIANPRLEPGHILIEGMTLDGPLFLFTQEIPLGLLQDLLGIFLLAASLLEDLPFLATSLPPCVLSVMQPLPAELEFVAARGVIGVELQTHRFDLLRRWSMSRFSCSSALVLTISSSLRCLTRCFSAVQLLVQSAPQSAIQLGQTPPLGPELLLTLQHFALSGRQIAGDLFDMLLVGLPILLQRLPLGLGPFVQELAACGVSLRDGSPSCSSWRSSADLRCIRLASSSPREHCWAATAAACKRRAS